MEVIDVAAVNVKVSDLILSSERSVAEEESAQRSEGQRRISFRKSFSATFRLCENS
jgi:hypothetical protein